MSYFLSNALGFFIQLAPCVVMIFLPFPEERLRAPRRWILSAAVLSSAALSALFPLLLKSFPELDMMGDLMMLAALVLALGCFVWLVRDAARKKVLVFVVVLFYALSQFWLVNAARFVLPDKFFTPLTPYVPVTAALFALSAAVTLPVMVRYVIRPLGDFLREMKPGEIRREFAAAILSTTLLAAAMMVITNRWSDAGFHPAVVLLELLALLEQVTLYWLLFQETLRRKRDSQRRRALEIQRLQYDKISQEMENARRLRHDLRHHLNVLGALNAQGKQEEIAAYLRQYGAVADRLNDLSSGGDPAVDGVLRYYLTQAEDLSVPVEREISLDADTGVDATDMTVLLGNCLENSLEALAALPADRRRLSLELRSVQGTILIRIRNTCAQRDDTGAPADWTAFADSGGATLRGVGLSSVSAIADKYQGSALFQRKDGVFTSRIILNPKHER